MLPKKYRLSQDRDFARVYQGGRFFSAGFIMLKVLARNNSPEIRFGIVVSAKVSKKANKRNLLKRRIRAIIQKVLPQCKNGFDVVVLTNKEVLNRKFAELEKTLQDLLKKSGVIS